MGGTLIAILILSVFILGNLVALTISRLLWRRFRSELDRPRPMVPVLDKNSSHEDYINLMKTLN